MTDEEHEVLDLLRRAWNKFYELPQNWGQGGHGDDHRDFCQLIHRLQDMVASRSGYRVTRSGGKV